MRASPGGRRELWSTPNPLLQCRGGAAARWRRPQPGAPGWRGCCAPGGRSPAPGCSEMPQSPDASRRRPQRSVRRVLGSGWGLPCSGGSSESKGEALECRRGRLMVQGWGLEAQGRSLQNLGRDPESPRTGARVPARGRRIWVPRVVSRAGGWG